MSQPIPGTMGRTWRHFCRLALQREVSPAAGRRGALLSHKHAGQGPGGKRNRTGLGQRSAVTSLRTVLRTGLPPSRTDRRRGPEAAALRACDGGLSSSRPGGTPNGTVWGAVVMAFVRSYREPGPSAASRPSAKPGEGSCRHLFRVVPRCIFKNEGTLPCGWQSFRGPAAEHSSCLPCSQIAPLGGSVG